MQAFNDKIDLHQIASLGTKRKFGNVFLLEDKTSKNLFVLKTARKDQLSDRALLQLRNEHTFSFSNPGLPQVVNFEENEETISILLRHKKGVGLEEYWNSVPKKQRLDFTKQLTREVVELLNEIHSKQIFHCDIKPSNILIEPNKTDFSVHLIDFGMSIDKTTNNQRDLIFPLGFGAPELILNRSDLINNTTDYFALGITIYRLWTGKLPLSHANPSVFTNLQLAHPISPDNSMPKKLNEWIAKVCVKPKWRTAPNLMKEDEILSTLLKSYEERYTNPNELVDAMEKVTKKRWLW